MQQFHYGHHVRLRSRVYGTYLHADEDGHGVSLHHRRASMNAAWVVHVYQPPDAYLPYLLLHSAAYGRYLAATNVQAPRGLHVEQRGCDYPEVEPIPWRAIRTESGDEVYLHDFHGGCLRANRSLHWNTGVSVDYVDDLDNPSPTMRWVVEPIPARRSMPRLPLPRPTGLHLALNHDELLWRVITYVWPDVEGALVNHDELLFRGRSVFRLRHELAWRLLGAIPTMVDVSQLVISHPPTYRVWREQEAAHTGCVWANIRIAHTCGRSYFMPHAQQVLIISTPRVWHEAKMPTRPGAYTLGTRGMTI